MVTPEPQLTALLEVIYRASLRARDLGYGSKTLPSSLQPEALSEIADLMDAIHNIPLHLTCYESWDEKFFYDSFLDVYDKKWSSKSGLKLKVSFTEALAGRGSVITTRNHFCGNPPNRGS